MRILGIDPGTGTTGYGLIDGNTDDDCKAVTYGVISTTPKEFMPIRLKILFEDINELIKEFKPDVFAIEELFFFKNSKTVITVSQARGVLLLAAIQNNLEIVEFTPLQIKQTLTGYGRADKREVQEMVTHSLGLPKIPQPDDAADALGVALCYLQTRIID